MRFARSTRMSRALGAMTALLAAAACASDPAAPSSSKHQVVAIPGLTLTATMSSTRLHLGQTGTLTIALHNDGPSSRTVNFGSGCQLLPYIERASDGALVYPDGGWACTANLTSLTLAPGETKSHVTVVHTGGRLPGIYTGAILPVGHYRAYGTLGLLPAQATTEAVEFEVVE